MIQKEWRRVFGTRTMLFVILFFLVVEAALLVYAEQKNSPYSAEAYCDAWAEVNALLMEEDTHSVLGRLDRHIEKLEFLEYFVEMGAGELYTQAGLFGAEAEAEIHKMITAEYPDIDIPVLLAQYRAGKMVRHTERPSAEQRLYEDVAMELRNSVSYPEYRQTLVSDAKRMLQFSVFAKPGTFGYRNIEATLEQYQELPKIAVLPTPAKSVATLFQGSVPGILLLFFLLYLCIPLYLLEKEEGTVRLTRTCVKGRKTLARTKVIVLLLGALLMQLLLYGVCFLVLEAMYGFPDLSRSIQSVSGFSGCVLPVTIGQYFLLLFLFRYGVLCLCALCMAFFCSAFADTKKAYIGMLVFFLIQVGCYYAVSANASYGALHFLNLWGMLRFDAVGNYLNLNLFGRPVSCLAGMLGVLGIGLCAAFPAVTRTFCKKPASRGRAEKKKKIRVTFWQTTSIFWHEGRKLFFDQKVLLILLAVFAVQIFRYHDTERPYSVTEAYYQYYMEILSGPLTPEKETYLKNEALRFRTLHAADSTNVNVQKALNAEHGFQKAYSRYLHIKNAGAGEFFYDTGYRYLLAEDTYKAEMLLMVTAVLLLTITGAGIFGADTENGMLRLLTTTRDGKKGIGVRLVWGGILTVMVWLLVYLPDFVCTLEQYGTEGLSAPAQSIELLAGVKRILLREYFVGLYLSRLLGLFVVNGTMYLLAYFAKSTAVTIFGTAAIFAIPPLLLLLNERMTGVMFPYAPFSGNLLRRYPAIVSGVLVAFYALFVFWAYKFMVKRRKNLFFLFTNCKK